MPTVATPAAPWAARPWLKSGNSSRDGTHLGPQKLTITGRPPTHARSIAAPSSGAPRDRAAAWVLRGWKALVVVRLGVPAWGVGDIDDDRLAVRVADVGVVVDPDIVVRELDVERRVGRDREGVGVVGHVFRDDR